MRRWIWVKRGNLAKQWLRKRSEEEYAKWIIETSRGVKIKESKFEKIPALLSTPRAAWIFLQLTQVKEWSAMSMLVQQTLDKTRDQVIILSWSLHVVFRVGRSRDWGTKRQRKAQKERESERQALAAQVVAYSGHSKQAPFSSIPLFLSFSSARLVPAGRYYSVLFLIQYKLITLCISTQYQSE